MAFDDRGRLTLRNEDWLRRKRAVAAVSYGGAELTGQVRFLLLMAGVVAAGSAAVAAHWDLPTSWLVPQWLIEWLMPRVG